jgi:hypothetical protein
MLRKKITKKNHNATRAGVAREMAKPCMARSAKIAGLKLDATRIPKRPSVTMTGTVVRIIPSRWPNQPEKAQIVVGGTDRAHRNLRFKKALNDKHGRDLKLKKGAHAEVTVTEDPKK